MKSILVKRATIVQFSTILFVTILLGLGQYQEANAHRPAYGKLAPTVTTLTSDDFNSCTLNTGLWTFENPVGDATLTLNGAQAEIFLPAGTDHDVWGTGPGDFSNTTARLRQTINDDDFELSVKLDSGLNTGFQTQGILVEQDNNDLIRFEYLRNDSSGTKVFAANIVNGSASAVPAGNFGTNVASDNTTPLYLRVTRTGDSFSLDYSLDGSNWTNYVTFNRTMTVSAINLHAGNSTSGSPGSEPAHTAVFDYAFNTASPISPEDSDNHVPVITTLGNGNVTLNPDQASYACGDNVDLTANPDPNNEFSHWSNGVISTTNPAQLTIDDDNAVTATFFNAYGNGPGGVGATDGSNILSLWLKADAGVRSDGACTTDAIPGGSVACWADQSGNGHNATAAVGTEPTLQANVLNNQPALSFDGTERLSTGNLQLFQTNNAGLTVFSVFDTNDNDGEKYILNMGVAADSNLELGYDAGAQTGAGNFGLNRGNNNATIAPAGTIANNTFGILATVITPTGATPANIDIVQNGAALTPADDNSGWLDATSYPTQTQPLDIGARNQDGGGTFDAYHDGDIAEIIIYANALNDARRILVENYLNAKYGIAISNDVYPSTTYTMTVAGIGAEATGAHTQASSDGLLLDEDNSSLAAGEYVLVGHQTPTNDNNTTDVPAGIEQRWERVWNVEKTASDGVDVTMTFDISDSGMTGSAGAAGNYVLLYSNVNAFNWSEKITGASAVNGDQITFTVPNTDLDNGFYTLATTDANNSPTVVSLQTLAARSNRPMGLWLAFAGLIGLATAATVVRRRRQ